MSAIVLSVIAAVIFVPVALSIFDGLLRFVFDGIFGMITGDAPLMLAGALGVFGLWALQGHFAFRLGQGIDGLFSTIMTSL